VTYKPGDADGYMLSPEYFRVKECIEGISAALKVGDDLRAGSRALVLARELGYELAMQGRLAPDTSRGHICCLVGRNATHEQAEVLANSLFRGVLEFILPPR
jgi:hypothetical protein